MNHRRKAIRRSALLGLLGALAAEAFAADAPMATAQLLGRCVACHGADGIGKAPQYPNLRGQKAAYLEKSLADFRSGKRADPNMSAMARDLSDVEIAALAAYFSTVD